MALFKEILRLAAARAGLPSLLCTRGPKAINIGVPATPPAALSAADLSNVNKQVTLQDAQRPTLAEHSARRNLLQGSRASLR